MLTKSEIANGYIDIQKSKYGDLEFRPTEESNVLILGARPGNIGGEIYNQLIKEDYASVQMIDLQGGEGVNKFDLVSDVKALRYMYANTDILIMCQGYTHIDWIENQKFTTLLPQVFNSLYSHILQTTAFVQETLYRPYKKQIIYVGSMAYRNVLNGSAAYCAAKAGLNMYARCAAWELAPKGYDVYILHPGNVVDTPMAEKTISQLAAYRGITPLEAREYWNTGNPRDTILTAHDIAVLVEEICDNKMMYAAGNPIDLTGGQR